MRRLLAAFTLCFFAVLFLCLTGTEARADGIVLLGPNPCFPAGVGRGCGPDRAEHILSLRPHPGNSTEEAGQVRYTPNGDVVEATRGEITATRGSNTQTLTLAQLGVSRPGDIRIYFDINENNRANITLNNLVLNAYNDSGQVVFSANLLGGTGPASLNELGQGQGHSDYIFGLDADAQRRFAAVFSTGLHIGLAADLSNAQGGPESFFIGSAPGANEVPEPTTMVLLGMGLAGVAAKMRKRRRPESD